MADDLKDTIRENAEGPKQASADGVSTQQHSLADQIEADKYIAGKAALADATKRTIGVRLVRLIPPGAS